MTWRWWQKYPQEIVTRSDSKVRRTQDFLQMTSFNEAVSQIRSLVSCPPAPFATLYEQTLQNMAQLTQDIPHTTDEQSASYFTHAVNRAVKALMLRREKLLPEGACAEQIAEEDAVWTFAVFSSALCHGFIDWARSWCAQWCVAEEGDAQSWHDWSPAGGGLPEEATHYRWRACDKSVLHEAEIAVRQGFVVAQIVPLVGVRWLQGFEMLWRFWWSLVGGRVSEENPLWEILRQARVDRTVLKDPQATQGGSVEKTQPTQDRLAEGNTQGTDDGRERGADDDNKPQVRSCAVTDPQNSQTRADQPEDMSDEVVTVFLKGLREALEQRCLPLNQAHAEIFTVETGWFMTLSVLPSFGVPISGRDDLSTLVRRLQEAGVLWQENGAVEIQRVHLCVRPPAVLQGIVVLFEHGPVSLAHKPYRFLKPLNEMTMERGG